MTRRLDIVVAERFGLSRTQAAAAIMAGKVSQDGRLLTKPGQSVPDGAEVAYDGSRPAVSRAGGKLAGALETWSIPVQGLTALDVGSSTGGFTEELLKRGAEHVIAVDVGTGQLAWKLRRDDRVTSLERTDIRTLTELPRGVDLAVIDVSFISLTAVLPSVASLLEPGTPVIALCKPQFEVGRKVADKHRGVITDPALIEQAVSTVRSWLTDHHWKLQAEIDSPVAGTKGNVERLLWLETPAT